MEKRTTDVAILGAGIAGLSAGWLLKNQGITFTILEKQQFAGGLARSFMWNNFPCDFAAHRLFTSDEHVLKQLLNLVPMGRHIRRSRIYLKGKWMRDPLDVLELITHLSPINSINLGLSYLFRPREITDQNFEDYVIKRYGQSLYDIFFRPYTEKLFGIKGDQISVLWAQQKVRLSNPLDKFRENTKTKFQYFYYPIHGGYGAIAENLFTDIEDQVILGTTVKRLVVGDQKIDAVIYEQDGVEYQLEVNQLISTLPITLTAQMLGEKLNLGFQKVEAVYLHINKPLASDYHWIYFMDDDIAINRMVEFKNMSPADKPDETTVLCAEVTQEHNEVIEKVINDLVRIGFIERRQVLDTKVIKENFSYPIYNRDYHKVLIDAQEIFSKYENLFLLGRAAEFKHREVDDNFSAAIETVDLISQKLYTPLELEKRTPTMEKFEHSKPLIYFVLLTFNNYPDTKECLQSVFGSEYDRFGVVLVDNGSTDGTPEKVRQDFPNTVVIENNENLGVPAGYNVGFQYALDHKAEFVLMLNNDTVIKPDMIDNLLESAESDPEVGIVMPKVLFYGSEDKVWSSGGYYRKFPPAIKMTSRGKEDQLRSIEYAPSCALLISSRTFRKVGLFDPGYFFNYDDWDFSERVRAHGFQIIYNPTAVMWHKVSLTTNPQSPLFWNSYGASIIRFYRRHGRPVWLTLPIHVGYIILRDFVYKGNWKFWKDFTQGMKEGMQKPLGTFPKPG